MSFHLLAMMINPILSYSGGMRFNKTTPNHTPLFPIKIEGKVLNTSLTIDSNWRRVHLKNDDTKSCFNETGLWNCLDYKTCIDTCLIDGITMPEWKESFNIEIIHENDSSKVQLGLPSSRDAKSGPRLLLLDESQRKYQPFNLLNKKVSFTVDTSKVGCGLNGALYFTNMDLINNISDAAGPSYGMGYSDAQIPTDYKYLKLLFYNHLTLSSL